MEEKDFEPAGLIPRSIIRTVERFRQQLRPETIALGIQEFRISRYQVRVSVRYFFILLLLPIAINWGAKNVIIKPLVGYFWNTYGTSLFLNSYQAERAFKEMRDFESQLFFEMLLSNSRSCPEANDNFKQEEQVLHSTRTSFLESSIKRKEILGRGLWHEKLEGPNQSHKPQTNLHSPGRAIRPSTSQHFVLLPLHKSTREVELTHLTKQTVLEKTSYSTDICKPKYKKRRATHLILKKDELHIRSSQESQGWTLAMSSSLGTELVAFGQDQGINKKFRSYNQNIMGYDPYNPNFIDRIDTSNCFEVLFQEKTYLLAEIYNQQSITALSNMFGDCIMIISIILLLRLNAPQFTILKSFLIESFYSFNDAIKCFYIILITDFLVGFHSPRGWEIVMEMLLRHLGLPENEEFILLFVGTFPVFLDTAFKYWIFRYLNKISPSTVATYHSMIE